MTTSNKGQKVCFTSYKHQTNTGDRSTSKGAHFTLQAPAILCRSPHPGLWRHTNQRTTFTFAVDNFGIKFFSWSDADHLFNALAATYALTRDWTGSSYLGFTISWNYAAGHADISMLDYVPKALLALCHPSPACSQHSPHRWTTPVYGQKKADGGEVDKTELIKLRFLLVPNKKASKDTRQIVVFKDGCLDKWI
jgi:hypothetical protein